MKINARAKLDFGAFTLTEVVVAMAIIGVGMTALLTCFSQGFTIVQADRENLRATQVLQEKMEMVRLYSWDQVTNGGYIPATFTDTFDPTAPTNSTGVTYTGTVILTNAPITETYAADLMYVNITVAWTSSGVAHSRYMNTFISRHGLQNYIY